MIRVLKIFALIILFVIVGSIIWIPRSKDRQTTATQFGNQAVTDADASTFVFKPNGDILVYALDCQDTGLTHQHATPNTRTTKIEGVNHNTDDVERVSSQFIRINGKLYDAYVAEFQRMGIDKTNNVGNDINERVFRVTDEEEQYFTDGVHYYYYESYPTFRACFSGNDNSPKPFSSNQKENVETEPIMLSEFQLNAPDEARFYLSQKNNIFTDERYGYTPFAALNGKLYFKSKSGKFVEVPGAKPSTVIELGETYTGHFFTDGSLIIFQGNVLDFDLSRFRQIQAGDMSTFFFDIEDKIYYLYIPTNAFYYDATLTETDIDAESFEAVSTTGSFSGIVYQDKGYIYKLKYRNTEWKDVVKIPRN